MKTKPLDINSYRLFQLEVTNNHPEYVYLKQNKSISNKSSFLGPAVRPYGVYGRPLEGAVVRGGVRHLQERATVSGLVRLGGVPATAGATGDWDPAHSAPRPLLHAVQGARGVQPSPLRWARRWQWFGSILRLCIVSIYNKT